MFTCRRLPVFAILLVASCGRPTERTYQGLPASFWVAGLGDADPQTNLDASWALFNLGDDAIPALWDAMQSPDSKLAASASSVLIMMAKGFEGTRNGQWLKTPPSALALRKLHEAAASQNRQLRALGENGLKVIGGK
jgi:hypothetical protein